MERCEWFKSALFVHKCLCGSLDEPCVCVFVEGHEACEGVRGLFVRAIKFPQPWADTANIHVCHSIARVREAITYQLCIFFNIVQTAFDPPPSRFEHVCCKFCLPTFKKVRKRLLRQNDA